MSQSESLIISGIEASIKRDSLTPLLRSFALALRLLPNPSHNSSTLFSCDSFCEKHLAWQLDALKAIKELGIKKVNFLNLPASHYITAFPNQKEFLNIANTNNIIRINRELVDVQTNQSLNVEKLISHQDNMFNISNKLTELYIKLNPICWKSFHINKFPFHELALRDLSLTYKCSPELALDPKSSFYKIYTISCLANIWLLSLLIQEDSIGQLCIAMSNYTATNVFRFFCNQTGRTVRMFNPAIPELKELVFGNIDVMNFTESPNSTVFLTHPSNTTQLDSITISPKIINKLDMYLGERFQGIGTHTYSVSTETTNDSTKIVESFINKTKENKGQVVSLYTSSPDEVVGQEMGIRHDYIDLSYLNKPPFPDQENWILDVIEYFENNRKNDLLIIRFHPRLAADKRGLPESPYLKQFWETILERASKSNNVKLIHPSIAISSYWLGFKSDLILNGWSTIGLEFALSHKLVTNAFYKCALGGAPGIAVHLSTPALASTSNYFYRLDKILKNLDGSIKTNYSNEVIDYNEAAKSYIVHAFAGVVPLKDKHLLRSQLANPILLTPTLISLLEQN